jgi:hypothetical protein
MCDLPRRSLLVLALSWDCDSLQDSPALWPVFRRAGHQKEIEGVKAFPVLPTVRLKTIGGYDLLQGGKQAVHAAG